LPTQSNPAIQNVPTIAWNGSSSFSGDIRKFVRFGWSFEVVTTLVADAIFNVEAAPPSTLDNCAPGTFAPVPDVAICDFPAVPGPQAQVIIPAGTRAGTICSGTIPCRPNAFVRLAAVSGAANVRAILLRQGPR
jgi:hypothetical protein